MNISSEAHPGNRISSKATPTQELSTVSHNLMGSISALLMCEHMLRKDLADAVADNKTLATTLSLLKETADQIRQHGDRLMSISNRCQALDRKTAAPEASE